MKEMLSELEKAKIVAELYELRMTIDRSGLPGVTKLEIYELLTDAINKVEA